MLVSLGLGAPSQGLLVHFGPRAQPHHSPPLEKDLSSNLDGDVDSAFGGQPRWEQMKGHEPS